MIYLYAFLIGGLICMAGQLLMDLTKLTPARILVLFVCLGVVLGGLGWYPKLVELAGAGATVPLTGFGNALAQGVKEAVQKDGLLGVFTSRSRQAFTGFSVVLALLVAGFGVTQALTIPQVREQEIAIANLPAEFDGLRIAVIADIHASPINDSHYVQGIVNRTLAANPDLIVLPGDMIDGDVKTEAKNIAPLSQLKAKYGVFSAPGNHEYYSGYDAWAQVYRALHLNYLENQTQRVKIKGRTLAVSGIGDPAYGRLSQQNADPRVPEGLPPDIEAVAKQAKGADFHLLLAHQPKLARDNAAQGVGLQISGHTHGGHILGMDRWLVAPVNNGFVRGAYDVDRMKLFVSSGAGLWAGFAVRLGVPSAIDLLVLRRVK